MTSNSADTTYHSTTTPGSAQVLKVVPRGGAQAVVIRRHPIEANYYHMGRILVVTEGPEDSRLVHNFVEPVQWSTAAP